MLHWFHVAVIVNEKELIKKICRLIDKRNFFRLLSQIDNFVPYILN